MRDPKRIRAFCNRLAAAWETMPDMRFGQLMHCVETEIKSNDRDPFYLEEGEMINRIEAFCRRSTGGTRQ